MLLVLKSQTGSLKKQCLRDLPVQTIMKKAQKGPGGQAPRQEDGRCTRTKRDLSTSRFSKLEFKLLLPH
jgi:hypothetical protein